MLFSFINIGIIIFVSVILTKIIIFAPVTYVCKEYSNLQDSKSILLISDFKIFPNYAFETARFWCTVM